MTFMSIMNSFPLYILVIAGLLFVFALCLVTLKQARQRALELGLSKEEIMGVIKSSALFSIVPSLSVVVGLFSLQAILGVPWSWYRLSVIGSVSYELIAADMAAIGAGYDSLAALVEVNDPNVAGAVMLAMSLGIIGGVVGCLFLGKSIQTGMASYRAKSGAWGARHELLCYGSDGSVCSRPKHLYRHHRHPDPDHQRPDHNGTPLDHQEVQGQVAFQLRDGRCADPGYGQCRVLELSDWMRGGSNP